MLHLTDIPLLLIEYEGKAIFIIHHAIIKRVFNNACKAYCWSHMIYHCSALADFRQVSDFDR